MFTQENISDIPTPDGPPLSDISDIDITTEGIDKLLTYVYVKNAPGPLKIPNQLLKDLAHDIATVIQCIYT